MTEVPVSQPDLVSVWERAIDRLSRDLPMRDRAFLTHTRPLAIVGSTVVVMVPNELTKREFESRSAGPVATALATELGIPVDIVVELVSGTQPTDDPTPSSTATKTSSPPNGSTEVPAPRPAAEPVAPAPDKSPTDPETGPTASRNGARRDGKTARLNPRYSFDSFVIGPSNRFAHAAAVAAAEAPGKAYNPLLIYGESGLGKTHLLHAIGHYAQDLYDGTVVRYVSSEEFTNEFINSIRDDRSRSFQRMYRGVDILLIDDIQFLEGKEQTQEEFFHTFNTLHNANKQIVITSDRPPKELSNLEDRLRNRFNWGLLTDVQPPDLETRIAILSKKANADNIAVPGDVLELIAAGISTNIRELEGALVRVAALANLQRQPIDVDLATVALRDLIVDDSTRTVAPELIMRITADYFEFDVADLIGRSRKQPLATSRQIAMYLCRELTDLSLPRIGELFGGRDHTTVMHAENKIRDLMNSDRSVYNQLTELTNRVKQSRPA